MRRRSTATALTLLLAAPALASCGFDYDTNEVTTISAGVNDRAGTVDILGAVIVADRDDAGVFAATFSNKTDPTASEIAAGDVGNDALVGLSAGDGGSDSDLSVIGSVAPIEVDAKGAVNLFTEGGIPVEGDFAAGDVVPVRLTFESGQVSTLQVPVQSYCHQYAVDTLKLPSESSSAGASEESADPEDPDGSSVSDNSDLYNCDYLDPVEMHGEPGEGGEEQEQFPSENEGE